jgi:spore coat polysaccharide biosynthesis protein SpsF
MRPTIVGVIQARMGSIRFPEKMAADLFGYPLIDWVIRRSLLSNRIDKLYVATSNKPGNKFLIQRSKAYNIFLFQGDENDVLSRFEYISDFEKPDLIVRICADNPLVSPVEIDKLIDFTIKNKLDYSFNHIPALNNGYVDGAGAEVMTFDALKKIIKNVKTDSEKEHITKYIWENMDQFKIACPKAPKELQFPKIRLDVNTENDLKKVSQLISVIDQWESPEDIDLVQLPIWLKKI